ncbi:MAG: MBOAT family protein [Lentisphaerae bacterium]|nr:MBOAT family protein [Lentisphaerota bacterium]
MLFNSLTFVVFLAVVYGVWRLLPGVRSRNAWLLLGSYVFYGAWDWRFLGLIFVSTLIDYVAARTMAGASPGRRRAALLVSLSMNLGLLGFFKYLDFGIVSMMTLLRWVGLDPHWETVGLILPVGISFYTFQTISYTVDVYRRAREPERNLLDFALYVAYFPQLVAGPIEQSTHLLPQLQRPRAVTREDVRVAFLWILLGYAKKIVMADTLAPMVNDMFAAPERFSCLPLLAGVAGFALQIYGDFRGYTLIARGVSRLFGVNLVGNFMRPYLALSPRDFWRRWHTSLSSWLRDYLYIPLGGSRHGAWMTARNLMLTMLLGGLWHGASWIFVLWGGYHGLLLVLCHFLLRRGAEATWRGWRRVAAVAVTFVFTLGGWVLFRIRNVPDLVAYLRGLTVFEFTPLAASYLVPVLAFGLLLGVYHVWQELADDELVLLRARPAVRLSVYVFLGLLLAVSESQRTPFIYFQF